MEKERLLHSESIGTWTALLIKIKSALADIFYIQERVGQNWETISVYKLRTMVKGADKLLPPEVVKHGKMPNDPRLLPRTKFLRRSWLDEVPQLINILKGDMAIFGARPRVRFELDYMSPRFLEMYLAQKPWVFGWYAFWRKWERSFGKLDRRYLRMRNRVQQKWRMSLYWFHAWVLYKCIKNLVHGANV